jgi:hypothetical protein
LVEKPEGKRPLRIPIRKWKYNIKTDLKETGSESVDWTDLGWGPMAGSSERENELSGSINGREFRD